MKITVKIDTDTPAGKHLESELRRHPESVEFIEPSVVADTNAAPMLKRKIYSNPLTNRKTPYRQPNRQNLLSAD
jgi:hypothetical protein